MSALIRLVQPFADLVRWGEPYDVEDDDPLLDASHVAIDEHFSLLS